MALRLPLFSAAAFPLAVLLGTFLQPDALRAADSSQCARKVKTQLAALPLAANDVSSVRLIQQINVADDGPDISGVDAWVQLNSCSGWLIINMTTACYVRQTYTRGDCRVEGLPNY